MFGLRATLLIIDDFVRIFSLLKYGVCAVLVFIGVKLVLSKVIQIPGGVVCAILAATLASSMAASVAKDYYERYLAERVGKGLEAEESSPNSEKST